MTLFLTVMSFSSGLASVPAGVWALIGTVIGSIGLKIVEKWLNRQSTENEKRRDLNSEIKQLQERLDALEEDVSEWRKRAYNAEEQVALLRVMVIQMGGETPEDTIARIQQPKQ